MGMMKQEDEWFRKRDGWQAGDEVVCVGTAFSWYEVGTTYTLVPIIGTGPDRKDYLRLEKVAHNGYGGTFVKVEEAEWE